MQVRKTNRGKNTQLKTRNQKIPQPGTSHKKEKDTCNYSSKQDEESKAHLNC